MLWPVTPEGRLQFMADLVNTLHAVAEYVDHRQTTRGHSDFEKPVSFGMIVIELRIMHPESACVFLVGNVSFHGFPVLGITRWQSRTDVAGKVREKCESLAEGRKTNVSWHTGLHSIHGPRLADMRAANFFGTA